MLADGEEDPPDARELEDAFASMAPGEPDPDSDPREAQLSLHAFTGDMASDTIRVVGQISSHQVRILIDGGSSYSFILDSLAQSIGLAQLPIVPYKVMVGSGQILHCSSVCRAVPINIQGHVFHVDLYTLALRGADLVLGGSWLKKISPVLMDYDKLTVAFFSNNSYIQLQGDKPTQTVGLHLFQRLARTEPEATLFSLHVSCPAYDPATPTDKTSDPNTNPDDPRLQTLLTKYHHIFSEPSTLPPRRLTDHTIPLLTNASPVNVRPYRYPHSQKLEIEAQVTKLLSTGWIQPSTSPFSSPVLLLKKKDGTWRMCVDYRALNALTVRDRFPLPTIDELLDELGHARIFSKLDLTSGFHQIRLASQDIHKTAFRTHDGHYEYRVMPFGLCNAPATFQATMNDIFRGLLRKTIIVFFDDILVFSNSMESHLLHLTQVFSILETHKFHLKASKCSFGESQVYYLGHIVAAGTVPTLRKSKPFLIGLRPKHLRD